MTACFKRFIFLSNILKNILKYILHYLVSQCLILPDITLDYDNGKCVKIVS